MFQKKGKNCKYQLALREWVTAATAHMCDVIFNLHNFTKREMEWSTTLIELQFIVFAYPIRSQRKEDRSCILIYSTASEFY